MKLPPDVPVMVLPNATLFPQSLLPLRIFEPRYRRMLADSLEGNRMFCVAMQKPGHTREIPSPVAGIGLIRVSVRHPDGTSHLVLQGIARVELMETVYYKPYRIQRIRPVETPPCDNTVLDGLLARVRELLAERLALGLFLPFPIVTKGKPVEPPPGVSAKDVLKYFNTVTDPERVADLVSGTVLSGPAERQAILETVNLESRLKRLIHFLRAEISQQKKTKNT